MATNVAAIKPTETTAAITVSYEHPWIVRAAHWLNAVAVFVLIGSGLRIFRAFPSFGPKIPQRDLINIPGQLTIGGWLGGALQWHFTFMWIFVGSGLMYLIYQFATGHWRQVLFTPSDIKGVWPMARHYFLFGPKPAVDAAYNPLQKLAYTSTIFFGRDVHAHRNGALQASAVLVAGLADGRIPLRAHLALCGDVRIRGLHSWSSHHGRIARLGQFLFHDHGMEARSGVSGRKGQSAELPDLG